MIDKEIWTPYAEIKKRRPLYDKIVCVDGKNHRADFSDIVIPYASSSSCLLDTGCGIADHMTMYAKSFGFVCGIDFNINLLNEAKKNTENYTRTYVACMRTENIGMKGNKFDVVTSVFNPLNEKTMKEIFRVMKKGGIFIRTSCAGDFVRYGDRILLRPQDVVKKGSYFDRTENYATSIELSAITNSGLHILNEKAELFKGIKLFSRFENFINHIRNSGHFRFHEPYEPLNNSDIEEFQKRHRDFIVEYENNDFFALPFDSLLIVAKKPC